MLLILVKALTEIKISAWRPSSLDTSVGADLYRIDFTFNYVIKKKDESIDDDEFYEMLKEVAKVSKTEKTQIIRNLRETDDLNTYNYNNNPNTNVEETKTWLTQVKYGRNINGIVIGDKAKCLRDLKHMI